MKNKNKKPLIFGLLLLTLAVIGGTFAYYYSEVVIPNRFKAMTYDVKLVEEFEGDFGTKEVSSVNQEETNTPVVIRMSYNEYWDNSLNNKYNNTDVVTKNWTNDFLNDFRYDSRSGWYYYTKVLNPESSVTVLNSTALNTNLVNASPDRSSYLSSDYHLDFNYEAIQAKEEAILDIWGDDLLNVSINGGNVSWSFQTN